MKSVPVLVVLTLLVLGCSKKELETKAWHTSPDGNSMSSTIYRLVYWSDIKSLSVGMSNLEAKEIIGDLQSFHHPINAIVYTEFEGVEYEVALKLSSDQGIIKDISYKKRQRN